MTPLERSTLTDLPPCKVLPPAVLVRALIPPVWTLDTGGPCGDEAMATLLTRAGFGEWDVARVRDKIRKAPHLLGAFVAYSSDIAGQGGLQGMACLYEMDTRRCNRLTWVTVDQWHRNQGIGRELVVWALAHSRPLDVRVEVDARIAGLVEWYQRMGFVEVASR